MAQFQQGSHLSARLAGWVGRMSISMSKAGRLVLRDRSYAGRVDLREAGEQVSIVRVTEKCR